MESFHVELHVMGNVHSDSIVVHCVASSGRLHSVCLTTIQGHIAHVSVLSSWCTAVCSGQTYCTLRARIRHETHITLPFKLSRDIFVSSCCIVTDDARLHE